MFSYSDQLKKFGEFGVVEEIYHPLALVSGLPGVKANEVVVFENGALGQVLYLHPGRVEVLLFSRLPVRVGGKLAPTGSVLRLSIEGRWLGQVVDPLGRIYGEQEYLSPVEEQTSRGIDVPPLSISQRVIITQSLLTGVSLVDLLLPLGKGQRELVVGDRKTGKSGFLLSVTKTQVQMGAIVVYVVMGKQSAEIEQLRQWLENEQILDRVVLVVTTALDSQSLIYLAPFTGMTVAEYFRDVGKNVVVIFDDLSTHAKYYREIALLVKRFPGRDSYPGDIFFTHARLLERAGNFKHSSQGEVAISCLPVAETTENDLSDYIVSNLIGITDGHLLFDSLEFVKGRRPAINSSLSVTRVGKQTQSRLLQDVSQRLMSFLSQYQKSQSVAHFGAELGSKAKLVLRKGDALYMLFNQSPEVGLPLPVELILVGMIWLEWLTDDSRIINEVRTTLLKKFNEDQKVKLLVEGTVNGDNFIEFLDRLKAIRNELVSLCHITLTPRQS